jgi:hypothetical protein
MEAEYVTTTFTAKEALWIKTMIEELQIFKLSKVRIYCDN